LASLGGSAALSLAQEGIAIAEQALIDMALTELSSLISANSSRM
jgi:glycerate-2-kinase